jgi:hypothetical protein
MFPFWTDLIQDSGSRMKSWGDSTKMIFGWYDMKEYGRNNTDNSFEVILYPNHSFEYRYDELDITNHDVIIGEVGANSSQVYQYLFYDECNTGTTNSSSCVSTNWNDSSSNTLLEGGGSLYGVGSGNSIDCSNPLNDTSCSGYEQAYLTQQCNITQLYSQSCPNYWEAYDDQQCADDPQYAPFCAGYRQEESVAFFDDSNVDYGFIDEQEQFATGNFDSTHDDQEFQDQFYVVEVYEEEMFVPYEEFDDHNDFFEEPFADEVIVFFDPEPLPFIDDFRGHDDFLPQEDVFVEQFILQETLFVEDFTEPENFLVINTIEELDDWFEAEREEHHEEHRDEEEVAQNDEPEEEFIEEIFEEEAVEEVFEELEEVFAELEEELIADAEEEIFEELDEIEEEIDVTNTDASPSKSKIIASNVIKNALNTASNSINYGGGNSQGSSSATGTGGVSSQGGSTSSGGISTSSSPSMSDQIASANAQNNQVLSMSSGSNASVTMTITPMNTGDGSTQVVMADVQVQDMQGQIDTAVGGVMTQSEADQIADKIIAQNIQDQQEEMQQEQQSTGEYSDESSLVALIGYVPQFSAYTSYEIPDQNVWYSSQDIYGNITMNDNIEAFYDYARTNINNLESMTKGQPQIWR